MLALAGDDGAKASSEAKAILDLETKLAEASLTRVERRDPEKTYHKMNRSELRALTPNWSWDNYFQEIGYTNIDSVDVSAPKFFETMSQALKDTPLDTWKTYLRWHLAEFGSGRICPIRLWTKISISTGAFCRAPRNCCRAGSGAFLRRTASSARRSARSTCRSIFRPRPRPARWKW